MVAGSASGPPKRDVRVEEPLQPTLALLVDLPWIVVPHQPVVHEEHVRSRLFRALEELERR